MAETALDSLEELDDDGLPRGWHYATLADVCQVERGITFPATAKAEQHAEGMLVCLRTANVQEEVDWDDLIYVPRMYVRSERKVLRPNDILISMANSRELVGKVCFVEHPLAESTFGGFIAAIRAFQAVLPKFLFYYLRAQRTQELLRHVASQTVNIANLSLGSIYPTPIVIPPLPEQRRIVARIEELFTQLDTGVAALKRLQVNLQRYKAAVLKTACEGKLVPQDPGDEPASQLLERILAERRSKWEEEQRAKGKDPSKARYEEPAPPDTEGLPELPEGWVWASVDQALTMLQYGTSVKADSDEDAGTPILRMGNIQDGQLEFWKLKYIDPLKEDISKYALCAGDILINRTNSPELVGKSALFNRDGLFVFASYLIRLRVDPRLLVPGYLSFCINSEIGRRHIVRVKHQVAGQANINSQDIRVMPVPLPSVKEQQRIVAEVERRLSVVQELEATIEANLKRAERLRQAILRQAFEGKLVSQDPNEEPAVEQAHVRLLQRQESSGISFESITNNSTTGEEPKPEQCSFL